MANLYKLTPEEGDNPLGPMEVLEVGLAWERIPQPGEDSAIGKLKGWGAKKKREAEGKTDPADMDAAVIFFTGDKPVKYLGLGNDDPFKDEATPQEQRSATHTGDSITGAGDGDDETITLRLKEIPKRFDRMMVVVGAHKPGARMNAVKDLKATVYDSTGGSKQAVGVIEPSLLETHEMLAIADVKRAGDSWVLAVNGTGFTHTKGDIRSLLLKTISVLGR